MLLAHFAHFFRKVLFALSTAGEWGDEHGGFHYPSFYNFVVDFFEDADDEAQEDVKELLQWWNRCDVFFSFDRYYS